jgi:outer membrane lipoprotein LolB
LRVRFTALLAVGLLAACATVPRAERIVAGRFSVLVAADGRQDSGSGRFTLAVDGEAITLDLASPLGTTLARVEVDARGARLTRSDNEGPREVRGASAELLTLEALGWPLPVAGFPDWIAGRPAPGKPVDVLADDAFTQDGWTIRVLERFDGGAPRRLQIERPELRGVAPAITLRLVLDGP